MQMTNEDKFFELWLNSKKVESSSFVTDTPLYWAWQGYLLGVKQEREDCASLCVEMTKWHSELVTAAYETAADAIRARSENE
jgi:hypothetical protein